MLNIIGDIAGNFKTLMALLAQMPPGKVIGLGDLNDWGPATKEVIEWFISQGDKADSLMGNHEHQMLDFYLWMANPNSYKPRYEKGLWLEHNGGYATLRSYLPTLPEPANPPSDNEYRRGNISEVSQWSDRDRKLFSTWPQVVPPHHITWLKNRPFYLEIDNLLLTHAPKISLIKRPQDFSDITTEDKLFKSVLWNTRSAPQPIEGKVQIFGHLSNAEVRYYTQTYRQGTRKDPSPEPLFALCLDSCMGGVLTGVHYPTMKIYQQPIID